MTSTAPTPATIDTATLTGAGAQNGKLITITASCELMHNQLTASAIDPNHDMLAGQDHQGSPLIFSIGSDGQLWLMRHDPAAAGGWSGTELTADMPKYTKVETFDLSQDATGRISVAAALLRADGSGSDVLYATLLSNDPALTDWTKFATLAHPVQGLDPAFTATRLTLGFSDDDAAPLLSVAGVIGEQQHYYVLTEPTKPAIRMEFPEDLGKDPSALIDMANGYAFGQRGIWFLYTLGDSQTLECTTFPSADQGSLTYDYSPGYKGLIPADMRYTCLALPTGSDPDPFTLSSDVFVGTRTGIYCFRGAHAGVPELVAEGLTDVRQIIVRAQGEKVSVWAMCSPSQLWYIAGTEGKPGSWNAPVLFSNDCVHVAPIRSSTHSGNEVFGVMADLSLVHSVQDPVSTMWQQSTIKAAGNRYLFNVATYTSVLHFADVDGTPLSGAAVAITASDWVYATVNGRTLSLDMDAAASVTLDANGTLTVIVPAIDIATPVLHVTGELFAEIVNIYPNGAVHQKLQAIKSGADLKAATAAGRPVVDPGMDDATSDGVASNVNQLAGAGTNYVEGTRPAGAVYLALDTKRQSGALNVAHLPSNFAVGIRYAGNAWKPDLTSVSALAINADGVLEDIFMDIGDALHWLVHTFEDGLKTLEQGVTYLADGASFVIHKIEDGLQFVLTIAGKVLTIALKTLGALLKALNFVLKLIGIDLTKILAWLGHLFGWDTIWDTHKLLASVLNAGLNKANGLIGSELAAIKGAVMGALNGARDAFDHLVLPPEIAGISPRQTSTGLPAGAQHSAPGTMVGYQVQHGGMLQGSVSAVVSGGTTASLVTLLPELVESVVADIAKLLEDAIKLCTDPARSVDTARLMLVDMTNLVFDPLLQIVGALFDALNDLVAAITSGLRDEIDIPFLSQFYSFITDLLGEEEPFTAINGTALLLAIPVVEMGRAFGAGTPFDGADGLAAPDLFDRLMPGPSKPAVSTPRSLAASAPLGESEDESRVSALAHQYSKDGGLAAAIIAIVENIATLVVESGGEESGGFSTGGALTATKIVLGMALIRYALTYPLEDPDMGKDAYSLKVTAWSVSLAGVLLTLGLKMRETAPSKQVDGAVNVIASVVTLILLLVADGMSGEKKALAWCTDIASLGSGIAMGAGTATENPYAIGVGLAAGGLGSVFGIALAVSLDSDEIAHFVGVGG